MSAPQAPPPRYQRDGFNLIAPLYDRLAALTFGGAIMTAQLAQLSAVREARRALIIGGGAGAQLKALLETEPQLTVTYLEASSKMISLAKRRLTPEQGARVTWVHDVHERLYREPELLREVDVVLTCFFLDVLEPLEAERLIAWVTEALKGEASEPRWLIADFYPHPGLRGALVTLMYLAFRAVAALQNQSLVDYVALARSAGWRPQRLERFAFGMIYAATLALKEPVIEADKK